VGGGKLKSSGRREDGVAIRFHRTSHEILIGWIIDLLLQRLRSLIEQRILKNLGLGTYCTEEGSRVEPGIDCTRNGLWQPVYQTVFRGDDPSPITIYNALDGSQTV
jgi:hypothetical protein